MRCPSGCARHPGSGERGPSRIVTRTPRRESPRRTPRGAVGLRHLPSTRGAGVAATRARAALGSSRTVVTNAPVRERGTGVQARSRTSSHSGPTGTSADPGGSHPGSIVRRGGVAVRTSGPLIQLPHGGYGLVSHVGRACRVVAAFGLRPSPCPGEAAVASAFGSSRSTARTTIRTTSHGPRSGGSWPRRQGGEAQESIERRRPGHRWRRHGPPHGTRPRGRNREDPRENDEEAAAAWRCALCRRGNALEGRASHHGSWRSSAGAEARVPRVGRTPGSVAGCNRPDGHHREQAVEAGRNREDGTRCRDWLSRPER